MPKLTPLGSRVTHTVSHGDDRGVGFDSSRSRGHALPERRATAAKNPVEMMPETCTDAVQGDWVDTRICVSQTKANNLLKKKRFILNFYKFELG